MKISSVEKMIQAGKAFSQTLKGGEVVGLIGPLGAGKTSFAKGCIHQIAKVPLEEILSPTYNLIHSFIETKPVVHHLDLFRLEREYEVENLGIEDLLSDDSILFIEWPEKFTSSLALCSKKIHFEIENTERIILIKD